MLTTVLTLAYIALVVLVVRPSSVRFARRAGHPRRAHAAASSRRWSSPLLLSALSTEFIGIHAIFGAFLLGAVIPHDSVIARELTHQLEDLVVVLLLPAFFAFTGMRTQIGARERRRAVAVCLRDHPRRVPRQVRRQRGRRAADGPAAGGTPRPSASS